MSKIEKTRENIKVTDLDEKSRKELFDRFIDAGGEIIKEKRKKGLTEFDREKQKQYRQRIEDHSSHHRPPAPASHSGSKPADAKKPKKSDTGTSSAKKPSYIDRLINKWSIKLHLYFMRVTDFSTYYFNPGFLSQFNHEYKNALLELQLEYLEIFTKNRKTGNTIIQKLDSLDPLYFEIIEMAAQVFDRTLINDIVDHSISMPDIPQRVNDLKKPLMELYRKLYILYPYQQLIYSSLDKALELQLKMEKGKTSTYTAHRKRIKNSLYTIYAKLFPRLHWLFCHYMGTVIDLTDPVLGKIMYISDDERPGRRESHSPPVFQATAVTQSHEDVHTREEQDTEQEVQEIPDHITRGLRLMNMDTIDELKKRFDQKKQFEHVSTDDKILYTSLLFYKFDHTYSFILTTSKIKFETQFTADGKIDYRSRLTDLYNEMRKVNSTFQNYLDIVTSYEKTRQERPRGNEHYIEYTKRLNLLEKKRNNEGRQARMFIKSVMDKVSNQLHVLIEDMEGQNRIISNPQDILEFDLEIEDKQSLQGKKIYQAIYDAYCYASALSYRLSEEGDLYGKLEFSDEEEPLQIQEKDEKKTSDMDDKTRDNDATSETGSILDELDDLI